MDELGLQRVQFSEEIHAVEVRSGQGRWDEMCAEEGRSDKAHLARGHSEEIRSEEGRPDQARLDQVHLDQVHLAVVPRVVLKDRSARRLASHHATPGQIAVDRGRVSATAAQAQGDTFPK